VARHLICIGEKLLKTRRAGGAEFRTMEAAATGCDSKFPLTSNGT
jgi:hypothetical protein